MFDSSTYPLGKYDKFMDQITGLCMKIMWCKNHSEIKETVFEKMQLKTIFAWDHLNYPIRKKALMILQKSLYGKSAVKIISKYFSCIHKLLCVTATLTAPVAQIKGICINTTWCKNHVKIFVCHCKNAFTNNFMGSGGGD